MIVAGLSSIVLEPPWCCMFISGVGRIRNVRDVLGIGTRGGRRLGTKVY